MAKSANGLPARNADVEVHDAAVGPRDEGDAPGEGAETEQPEE